MIHQTVTIEHGSTPLANFNGLKCLKRGASGEKINPRQQLYGTVSALREQGSGKQRKMLRYVQRMAGAE